MALTHFAFSRGGYLGAGGIMPALDFDDIVSEGIAPSGSNQQTTAEAPNVGQRPLCLVSTDTAVYVAFGSSPNATTAASRVFVPANAVVGIICNVGDKAAVVTI